MAIKNNLFKMRVSNVTFEPWKRYLPGNCKGFSDLDAFTVYRGQRLFIEMKHELALRKWNKGVSHVIDEFFATSSCRGEFGIVIYGVYDDHNLDSEADYYSVFTPTAATLYSPEYPGKPRHYTKFGMKSWEKFLKYWGQWVDEHPLEASKGCVIDDSEEDEIGFE